MQRRHRHGWMRSLPGMHKYLPASVRACLLLPFLWGVAAVLASSGEPDPAPRPAADAGNAARTGTEVEADPLDRRLDITLWGGSLREFLNQVSQQTGVSIIPERDIVLPADYATRRIYMVGSDLTVRQAVEWLSRILHSRYRVVRGDTIRLSGGYHWIDHTRPGVVISDVETIVGLDGDLKQFEEIVMELTKVSAMFEPDFSVRIVESDPDIKVVAYIPQALKDQLMQALRAMETKGRDLEPPRGEILDQGEMQVMNKLQLRMMASYKNRPVLDVLRDIHLQTGLNIGFFHDAAAPEPPPSVTIDLGYVPAARVIEALADALGLRGYEISVPDAVWIGPRPHRWTRMASRAFLWEQLVVESYFAGPLHHAMPEGESLPDHIRRHVNPDLWLDPATAVVYHPPSGNLIVVAPPQTQEQVAAVLWMLMRELERKIPR